MKLLDHRVFLLVILKLMHSDAARILGVLPYQGKSHFLMGEKLFKVLAKQGHRVDVISHFPLKKPFPNYTDIVSLEGTIVQLVNNVSFENMSKFFMTSWPYAVGHVFGNALCTVLGTPKMQKFINDLPNDPPYELVITQLLGAHCYMAFGHLLKVPVVGLSTCAMYPWMNDPFGNPDNTAYMPNMLLGFNGSMSFWQRLQNTVVTLHHKILFNYYTSVQDVLIKKYFGEDAPGVREIERSAALILTNTHYSLNGVRPFTPGVIEVGGLHIQDNGPELSPSLQKWLDESEKGFVYFSFGSMIKIESIPEKLLLEIYASLAKIAPVRVLIKIAEPKELPPGLPRNVLTLPWISQIKVLKHKNIRAFITHGGLMGTQEAIHYGVPMVGIPLFGDQILNIRTYVNKKIAVSLNYEEISKEKLDAALDTILNDPQYRRAAKKLSAEFQDRPLSATETATFWIEYVIKHGPNALRSPVLDLNWWQEALLDVFGALLLGVLLVAYLLKIIIRTLTMAAGYKSDNKRLLLSKKIK